MDVPLSFDLAAWEDEQPVLALVTAGFFVAMTLLFPAVVDAVRCGCLAVGRCFAVDRVARLGEGLESCSDPCGPESSSEGPWHPWS
jgi:hypothetical protein